MIRLIATDLDGTLLSDPNTIHPDNVAALREAVEAGVHLVAASGRRSESSSLLMLDAGFQTAHIIGANGCQICDAPLAPPFCARYLPVEAAREGFAIAQSYGLIVSLYTDHTVTYGEEAGMRLAESGDEIGFHERLRACGLVRVCAGERALEAALREGVFKLFAMSRTDDDVDGVLAARRACARLPHTELTSTWHNNFELMPAGVHKGWALETLACRLGIAREEVVAFGDSENDIPMLRWAGTGVAMANASEEVRAAADAVTGPCREGGVAQALRRMLRGR